MMDALYDAAWKASWASDECAKLFSSARRLAAGTGSVEEVEATIDLTSTATADEYYDVLDYANAVISSVKERA